VAPLFDQRVGSGKEPGGINDSDQKKVAERGDGNWKGGELELGAIVARPGFRSVPRKV